MGARRPAFEEHEAIGRILVPMHRDALAAIEGAGIRQDLLEQREQVLRLSGERVASKSTSGLITFLSVGAA